MDSSFISPHQMTPEMRRKRRRRRIRRTLRRASPYLGLLLLCGVLILSVNLIEYSPPPPKRTAVPVALKSTPDPMTDARRPVVEDEWQPEIALQTKTPGIDTLPTVYDPPELPRDADLFADRSSTSRVPVGIR